MTSSAASMIGTSETRTLKEFGVGMQAERFCWRALCVLVGLLTFGASIAGQARGNYDARLEAAQSGLLEELESLSKWCSREKLFAAADRANRQLIELDPDHEAARKALRYRKRKGVWVQSASYRTPKNHKLEALADLAARKERVLGGYKQRLFALNTEFAEEVSLESRERTLEHLKRLLPNDREVRAALGESLVGENWVLTETAVSQRRRLLIPDLARSCLATSPEGTVVDPSPTERSLELRWTLVLKSPYLRVAGTGKKDEVRNVLRATLGAAEFFRSLLGTETLPPVGFEIFLLANQADKQQFLDRHHRVKASDRPFFETLLGAGIPGTGTTAEWAADERVRLEHSVRQTVGGMLSDDFRISPSDGALWDGLITYLTFQVVGTRKVYTATNTRYAVDEATAAMHKRLYRRLHTDGADWRNEARIFFAERSAPRLSFLLSRAVNDMTIVDRLWAYVFAAYLIEGWPGKANLFIEKVGGGMPVQAASRVAFGVELGKLEDRLVRWLAETE